jgi:hypothetical protein
MASLGSEDPVSGVKLERSDVRSLILNSIPDHQYV